MNSKFPEFFPSREQPFTLLLPDGAKLNAKICQQGGKALMSNPNSDLGKWLLRDILKLKEKQLVNYEKLEGLGIDSVMVRKIDNSTFDIDFAKIGSFEEFASKFNPADSNTEEE